MDFLSDELLSGELAPIMLGYSPAARDAARRLFHRHRVITHVFCSRVPFLKRFSLTMKFHPICGTAHDELILTALEDFADSNRGAEAILYLIPATRRAARLIRSNRERLESRFVIASQEELRRLYRVPAIAE